MLLPGKPSAAAFFRRAVMSPSDSFERTKTLQRDSRAEFSSNEGFSVVAPMRVMLPFSMYGRNSSCWVLLKRWISSTKSTVLPPREALASASDMILLISGTPSLTADIDTNSAPVERAIIPAKVVFPVPGGPQRIIEGTLSASMACLRNFPFPRRASCPTYPSRVFGRILLARGSGSSVPVSNDVWVIREAPRGGRPSSPGSPAGAWRCTPRCRGSPAHSRSCPSGRPGGTASS